MKYKVYATVHAIPKEGSVSADLILVTDGKGKFVDYLPGPATIDGYEGTFTEKKAKESVKDWVKESFELDVEVGDVQLLPFERLSKMVFKIQNR
jgi:hypothetical protein